MLGIRIRMSVIIASKDSRYLLNGTYYRVTVASKLVIELLSILHISSRSWAIFGNCSTILLSSRDTVARLAIILQMITVISLNTNFRQPEDYWTPRSELSRHKFWLEVVQHLAAAARLSLSLVLVSSVSPTLGPSIFFVQPRTNQSQCDCSE